MVYIGSSNRKGNNDLQKRIMEYCRRGSHRPLQNVINKVLKSGYELHVRVKSIPGGRKKVKDEEKKMLEKYDYAWNKQENDPSREKTIPPCPPT